MSRAAYDHNIGAHCESSSVAGLLRHAGLQLSEAMVFGMTGAMFFGYFNNPMLPFPTFVVRNQPGKIRKNLQKFLGVRFQSSTFRDPVKAVRRLDELVEKGIPVAVQVDMFYMSYIPEYARAHFNGHQLVVVGKENGTYLVSDAYALKLVELSEEELLKARFAKGPFAPRGLMFHVAHVPDRPDLAHAIRRGIKHAAFYMLRVPVPFLGARGIRRFAIRLPKWPGYTRDLEHLSHEIMMIAVILEDRGTGGGGFRFLYAAFLQEAAEILTLPELEEASKKMMANGDEWRKISLMAARIGRNRDLGEERIAELSEAVLQRADAEKELFEELARIVS